MITLGIKSGDLKKKERKSEKNWKINRKHLDVSPPYTEASGDTRIHLGTHWGAGGADKYLDLDPNRKNGLRVRGYDRAP